MKKYLITAAVVLAGLAIVYAGGEMRNVPRGDPQALATADYGGVAVSTLAFGVSGTGVLSATACVTSQSATGTTQNYCSGVFYGVLFSSGNGGNYDFVDVFDSTSTDQAIGRQIARIYNVNGSTASAGGGSGGFNVSGFSGPAKPIRFNLGLIWRPSTSGYNLNSVLFYKESN